METLIEYINKHRSNKEKSSELSIYLDELITKHGYQKDSEVYNKVFISYIPLFKSRPSYWKSRGRLQSLPLPRGDARPDCCHRPRTHLMSGTRHEVARVFRRCLLRAGPRTQSQPLRHALSPLRFHPPGCFQPSLRMPQR